MEIKYDVRPDNIHVYDNAIIIYLEFKELCIKNITMEFKTYLKLKPSLENIGIAVNYILSKIDLTEVDLIAFIENNINILTLKNYKENNQKYPQSINKNVINYKKTQGNCMIIDLSLFDNNNYITSLHMIIIGFALYIFFNTISWDYKFHL